jgi:hypothetical protein
MKYILIILALTGLAFIGLTLLDYFGYYIDWDRSIISLSAIIPIITGFFSFISSPFKSVKKIRKKMEEG